AYELSKQSLQVERQQSLPVTYKGITLNSEYRIDIIVNQQVVIELKSIKQIESVHKAQLLTYLRMSELKCGLLLNFNVSLMKNGIYRVLNGWDIA
ncbi:MAG: GxxExxY protein, partial [Psychrosphaera sp.]|nr:GxxExxY protein [Psychrosphaera sp.]